MSLEIILGPMFAGKSSTIQSIIRRHQALGWKVCVLTHSSDLRYSDTPAIVNHDRIAIPAVGCNKLMEMRDTLDFKQSRLVIIEEAQFFDDLIEFVSDVVDNLQKHVVVVGLDGDAFRRPFGHILELIPYCDKVTKLTAMCKECGNGSAAIFTYAHTSTAFSAVENGNTCVGSDEKYTALCRKHYHLKMNPCKTSQVQPTEYWGC